MRTRSLVSTALLLCGCGLHHRPAAPEPARGPVRDSLFHFDESRSDTVARRGPVDGMLALMDADVVFLRAGAPAVYGRDGVRVLIAPDADRPAARGVWQPLGGTVSDDRQSAYTFGVAARPADHGDHVAVRLERYVAFWRRTATIPWRITAYAEVDAPPAAGELSLPAAVTSPSLPILPRALDEMRTRVRAADSLFSDLANRMGVGYAFANTVAPTGVVFGNPALVVGPDAVREYFASRGELSLAWKPVFAAVAGSGDLGFTIGESINTVRGPSGAAVQRFGKYLTVWQRQKDGGWKFVVDGGNSSPAPDARR